MSSVATQKALPIILAMLTTVSITVAVFLAISNASFQQPLKEVVSKNIEQDSRLLLVEERYKTISERLAEMIDLLKDHTAQPEGSTKR